MLDFLKAVINKGALYYFIFLLIFMSCRCNDRLCGAGRYRCSIFVETDPYIRPIKNDILNNLVLFENGMLIDYNFRFSDHDEIDLASICQSDSIRDFIYYNGHLNTIILSSRDSAGIPQPQDYFILVITPLKCCKLDTNFTLNFEFGFTGPPEENLIDATSCAIDIDGNSYIADRGDNSVKIFDIYGNFLTKWSNIGIPSRLKLFSNAMYILDSSADRIERYDMRGNYLGSQPGISQFSDITAFGFTYRDVIWIADMGGQRISELNISGQISEFKTGYCFNDVDYDFIDVFNIEGYVGVFEVMDRDANRLLAFSKEQ